MIKKGPAFERPLPPEYITNDTLKYLIEQLTFPIIFRFNPGCNWSLRSDSVRDFLIRFPSRNL